MDADKAYDILRSYRNEHSKDMTPDELDAFDMALGEIAHRAQAEQEQVQGEPERRARLAELERQGILP